MTNELKSTWRLKDVIFCILLLVGIVVLLYVFCECDLSKILSTKNLPVTFYIIGIVYVICLGLFFYFSRIRYYLIQGLDKYLVSQPSVDQSDSFEELQKKIVLPQKESSTTFQEIKEITYKKEQNDFNDIFKYLKEGRYELAISEISHKLQNVDSEKKEFICRYILYYAYIDCENDIFLNDAINNLKKFIPLIKKYNKNETKLYWEARCNLIIAYARQNNFEIAKKENICLMKEIRSSANVSDAAKFMCYNMQAIMYLQEGNTFYAMGYFEKAMEYNDKNFDTYFNMAMTYYYTENDLDNCLECINKINITSIEDEEHYRQLITMKCYCLSLKKEYFSAYKILDNYHHFGEITNSLKGYKAYIAYKLGKFDEAKKLSDEVLSSVYDATSQNVRGMLQIREGDYKNAFMNLSKLETEFNEGDKYYLGELLYNCSFVCLKLKKINKAIDYFNKSKELHFSEFDPNYIVELDLASQNIIKGCS